MDIKTALRMSASVLFSQLSFFVALAVDTYFISRQGTDALASWGVIQPYWLSLFVFGNGCLIALDRHFSEAFHREDRVALVHLLSSGGVLALYLSVLLLGVAYVLTLAVSAVGESSLLILMSATFVAWFPFVVLRQYLISTENLRALDGVSLLGLAAHVFILWLAPESLDSVPLAHLLDRVIVILALAPVLWKLVGIRSSLKFVAVHAALHKYMKLGVPYALQLVVRSLVFVLIATWLAQFGRSMIAAQGILTSLGNLLIIVPFSVSMVASVLIARAGSNGKLQQTLTRRLLGLGGLLTVSFALALKFCETPVLQAMTADPEVLMLLEKSFPYMLVFILVDTFQTILTGVFRGNQRTLQPFLFYSSFFFGLGLPLGFFVFSTFWHPLVGIWLALTVGSLGLGVALWRTHVQVLRYC